MDDGERESERERECVCVCVCEGTKNERRKTENPRVRRNVSFVGPIGCTPFLFVYMPHEVQYVLIAVLVLFPARHCIFPPKRTYRLMQYKEYKPPGRGNSSSFSIASLSY